MNIKKSKNTMNLMPYTILALVVICSYLFLNTIGTKVPNKASDAAYAREQVYEFLNIEARTR